MADIFTVIEEMRQKEKTCVRCGKQYRDTENLGQWKCRQRAFTGVLRRNGERMDSPPSHDFLFIRADHISKEEVDDVFGYEYTHRDDVQMTVDFLSSISSSNLNHHSFVPKTLLYRENELTPYPDPDAPSLTASVGIRRFDWIAMRVVRQDSELLYGKRNHAAQNDERLQEVQFRDFFGCGVIFYLREELYDEEMAVRKGVAQYLRTVRKPM